MKLVFLDTPLFTPLRNYYLSDESYRELQQALMENPKGRLGVSSRPPVPGNAAASALFFPFIGSRSLLPPRRRFESNRPEIRLAHATTGRAGRGAIVVDIRHGLDSPLDKVFWDACSTCSARPLTASAPSTTRTVGPRTARR